MDALLRLCVLSASLACVLGGYLGYQQPPPFFGYQAPSAARFYHAPLPLGYYQAPPPVITHQLAAPALPQYYYSAPSNTPRGFAYHTEYQQGGHSQVVFVTGPQSQQLMEQSLAAFRSPLLASITPKAQAGLPLIPKAQTVIPLTPNVKAALPVTSKAQSVLPLTPNSQTVRPQGPNIQPILAGNPVASVYSVQVFPQHGVGNPFLRVPFPHHPFISSFYSQSLLSPTNVAANATANATETVSEGTPLEEGTIESLEAEANANKAENAVESDSTSVEAEENVGEEESPRAEAEESAGQTGENGGEAEEENAGEVESTSAEAEETANEEETVDEEENGGDSQASNTRDVSVPAALARDATSSATEAATSAAPQVSTAAGATTSMASGQRNEHPTEAVTEQAEDQTVASN